MDAATKWLIGIAGVGAAYLALKPAGTPIPIPAGRKVSPPLRAYVARMLPLARDIEADGGPPTAFGLAQSAVESANGRSLLSSKYNNHFGIKAFENWKGGRVTLPTREWIGGRSVMVDADFRTYPDDVTGWKNWASVARYLAIKKGGLPPGSRDPRSWADAVAWGGWATDPRYAAAVRRRIDLVEAVLAERAPVAGPRRLTPAEIARIARGAGFSGRPLVTMTAIGLAESDGDPGVRNGQHVGIWQVAAETHGLDPERLEDPVENALAARKLYLWAGKNKPSPYQPWGAWKDGRYLARLAEAERAVEELFA